LQQVHGSFQAKKKKKRKKRKKYRKRKKQACWSRLFFLLLKVFMEMTLKSAGMFTNDMLKDVNIKFRL
jgi:hypothetical protein